MHDNSTNVSSCQKRAWCKSLCSWSHGFEQVLAFFRSIIWGKESEVPLFFLLWTETTQQHSCQSNNMLLSRWKCISGLKKNYNRLKHTKCWGVPQDLHRRHFYGNHGKQHHHISKNGFVENRWFISRNAALVSCLAVTASCYAHVQMLSTQ